MNKIIILTLVFAVALSLEPRALSPVYAADKGAGPVAHWKFDEGGGPTAYDESANNNDGTLAGNAKFIVGKTAKGIQLFGAGDWITFGSGASLNISTDITIEAWVNGDNMLISSGTQYGVFIDNSGGNRRVRYWYWGATTNGWVNYATDYGTVPASGWSHIAVVNIPGPSGFSLPKIYVNGAEKTVTGSPSPQENNSGGGSVVYLGEYAVYRPYNQFVGKVDDVLIYNYARTADQVMVDYNAGSAVHLGAGVDPNEGNPPIGYWSFDENTGTTTYDRSGNGNNGTLGTSPATPTWAQGKYGSALSFDGTDDYLSTSATGLPSGNSPITYSFWIKPGNNSGGDRRIIEYGNETNGHNFNLYINNNTYRVDYWGADYDDFTSTIQNAWQYVVFLHDGTSHKFYLNGVLIKSTTHALSITNDGTVLFGKYAGGGYNFNGIIDDVKIYNGVRTPAQIAYDYNKGMPVAHYKFEEGGGAIAHNEYSQADAGAAPVAWWRLDEGTGTACADSSGNGKTANMTGTASTWIDGRIYKGVSTDNAAASSYLQVSPSLAIGSTWTAEWWANFPLATFNNSWRTMFRSDVNDHQVIIDSGGNLGVYDNTSAGFVSSGYNINSLSGWHHIAAAGSRPSGAGTTTFYIDGTQVGVSNFASINPIYAIGNYQGGSQNWGKFDDVRIYNYVRTAEQIYNDYKTTHGTLVGDTKFVDGKIGKALYFDGTGDYVTTTFTRGDLGAYYSIGAWFKYEGVSGRTYSAIFGGYDFGAGTEFFIGKNSGNTDIGWQDGNYISNMATGTSAFDGNWHYLTITMNDTSGKLYLDGILLNTQSFSKCNNSEVIYIGTETEGAGYPWIGKIDDVKIYNYVRLDDQVLQDYNAGVAVHLGAPLAGEKDPWGRALPVGYWKLDENTGVLTNDASGNGNNAIFPATSTNQPSWTQGKNGSGLSFDGNDYLQTVSGYSAPSALTLELWVYFNNLTGNYQFPFNSIPEATWRIGITSAGNLYFDAGSHSDISTSINVSTGAWHHLVTTAENSGGSYDYKVYLDGIQVTSGTVAANIAAVTNVCIGDYSGGGYPTNGKIDEVKIYDCARTQAEIAWDYNKGKPVANWKFEEGSGANIYDESDNNNDATIVIGGGGAQATVASAWTNGALGKFGKCMSFDGTDDYISFSDSKLSFGAQPFTFSLWMKPSGTGTPFYYGTNSTNSGVVIYYDTSNSKTRFGRWGNDILTPTITQALNQWSNIAYTYDGTALTAYVNGVAAGSTNVTLTTVLSAGRIGSALGSQYFPGLIDDARYYNYARTVEQVQQDYLNGAAARLGD